MRFVYIKVSMSEKLTIVCTTEKSVEIIELFSGYTQYAWNTVQAFNGSNTNVNIQRKLCFEVGGKISGKQAWWLTKSET